MVVVGDPGISIGSGLGSFAPSVMGSTRMLISTDSVGSLSGNAFNDKTIVPGIGKATISKILIGHSNYVCSLTVHYGSEVATTRGVPGSEEAEIILEPGEFITSLEGCYSGGPISQLILGSNNGKYWGPYGTLSLPGKTFDWQAPGTDMGLLYFCGRTDMKYIWQLQATWAKYTPNFDPPSAVHYEEHISDDCSTSAVILSKFGRNLMSPIVTLVVGADHVEFHACESILCNLPFFRAAFKGGFREAAKKKIKMPEDEPEIVSSLIEFLYNDIYTYAYDPRMTVHPPPGDLREGAFHIRVYAIATKYSCQPLAKTAVINFIRILLKLKGIDVVKHWKTAYEHGLFLSDWEDDEGLAGFKKGLAKLLKDLYVAHREEMDKVFAECPALGTDFLRVAVCSGISS